MASYLSSLRQSDNKFDSIDSFNSASSVCEDRVGKHGEVAEWQTHEEYWNFTQPEGLLKSESSSRFESGLFHINVGHTSMAKVSELYNK